MSIFFLIINLVLSIFPLRIFSPSLDIPVVHSVFFFNPECEICTEVWHDDILPLQTIYGSQFVILQIDTTQEDGWELFQAMGEKFHLSEDRIGTPSLVIGETVLVGREEIPSMLPDLIEKGIGNDGVTWPDIPGIQIYLLNEKSLSSYNYQDRVSIAGVRSGLNFYAPVTPWEKAVENFKNDLLANSLAVIVLIFMVASVIIVLAKLVRTILSDIQYNSHYQFPIWLLPLLTIIGLCVSGYLTYIEISEKIAVCGPVGNCNTVQNSPYAKIFGILPIGILGLIGYMLIMAGWGIYTYGPRKFRYISSSAIWGLAFFGIVFSIYLTFLEPFIIGATCMWCLSSAILMTLIYWLSTIQFNEEIQFSAITNEETLD